MKQMQAFVLALALLVRLHGCTGSVHEEDDHSHSITDYKRHQLKESRSRCAGDMSDSEWCRERAETGMNRKLSLVAGTISWLNPRTGRRVPRPRRNRKQNRAQQISASGLQSSTDHILDPSLADDPVSTLGRHDSGVTSRGSEIEGRYTRNPTMAMTAAVADPPAPQNEAVQPEPSPTFSVPYSWNLHPGVTHSNGLSATMTLAENPTPTYPSQAVDQSVFLADTSVADSTMNYEAQFLETVPKPGPVVVQSNFKPIAIGRSDYDSQSAILVPGFSVNQGQSAQQSWFQSPGTASQQAWYQAPPVYYPQQAYYPQQNTGSSAYYPYQPYNPRSQAYGYAEGLSGSGKKGGSSKKIKGGSRSWSSGYGPPGKGPIIVPPPPPGKGTIIVQPNNFVFVPVFVLPGGDETPVAAPAAPPTLNPTSTNVLTEHPSSAPSAMPSSTPVSPSATPSVSLTERPSVFPTEAPTVEPTISPTELPTSAAGTPTLIPGAGPTVSPSQFQQPSTVDTQVPSLLTTAPGPTAAPGPTIAPGPTFAPAPTVAPGPTTGPAPTLASAPTFGPAPTIASAPTIGPGPTTAPGPTQAVTSGPTTLLALPTTGPTPATITSVPTLGV